MLDIKTNISLKEYNTFHVDQNAKYFIEVSNVSDIYDLLDLDIYKESKHFILGGGANVLFTTDFEGLVIKLNILHKEILEETKEEIILKIGAGEDRHQFVMRCVENNYGGIENLVYVPGTVGACPIQNIGAYGTEVSQSIYQVYGVNLESKAEIVLNNSDCKFSYRDSIFKHDLKDKFIITHVSFKLKKVTSDYKLNLNYKDVLQRIQDLGLKTEDLSIKDIANIIMEIRKHKLPDWKQVGTAGSFFQNPIISKEQYLSLKEKYPELIGFDIDDSNIKLSAGQLIEICGFKGYREGDAGVYTNHALVLVNYYSAKGKDIIELAETIQEEVRKRFKVDISPEVNYI